MVKKLSYADYIKEIFESNTYKEFNFSDGWLITNAGVTITFPVGKFISTRDNDMGIPMASSYQYTDDSVLIYGFDKLEGKLKIYTYQM